MQSLGRLLLAVGAFLILLGLLFVVFGRLGLGKLPGDFIIRRGNLTIYFPLVTSIIISIVLSLLLWLFRR